jgi:hypothetical protein
MLVQITILLWIVSNNCIMKNGSYWSDKRDIPSGKYGKTKLPDCECTGIFTCRVCLDYSIIRDKIFPNS